MTQYFRISYKGYGDCHAINLQLMIQYCARADAFLRRIKRADGVPLSPTCLQWLMIHNLLSQANT